MNLKAILEWARKIDPQQVDEKKRHHVKCYKDMIIEKGAAIDGGTVKLDKWMNDINEYIVQLKKAGVVFGDEPQREDQPSVASEPEKRVSPLLP